MLIKTSLRRCLKQGYSLVEMAMVMGIVAAITATFLVVFGSANTQQQVDNTVIEVNDIVTQTHGLFAAMGYYSAITTAYIAANGSLPVADTNGTTIESPFHTAVTIAPYTNIKSGDSFAIDFANISVRACDLLAVTNWGHYFVAMSVNGTVVKTAMTPATAQANCTAKTAFNLYFD
jgi:type II secretory pathway pseudopilin PulG